MAIGTNYADGQGLKGAGVDCAYFPLRVAQAVGLVPMDFKPKTYSPQTWLNNPCQTDKMKLKFEDRTFLDVVLKFADHEIFNEEEIQPGDLMLVMVAASWTHCGVIIEWPNYVLHPVKELGVIGSHGKQEGFWAKRPKRFFSLVK